MDAPATYCALLLEREQFLNHHCVTGHAPSIDALWRLELLLAAESPTPELVAEWADRAIETLTRSRSAARVTAGTDSGSGGKPRLRTGTATVCRPRACASLIFWEGGVAMTVQLLSAADGYRVTVRKTSTERLYGYRVTVRKTSTERLFASVDAAYAEYMDRCSQGQRATLWAWMDATDDYDAGWEPLATWLDYDDLRDEAARRGDEPNPREGDDDEARDTAAPR